MAVDGFKGTYLLPASYAQERMWVLDQLEPKSTTYHIPFVLKLEGKLNVEIMQSCLNEIVSRHEVFRTAFTMKNGKLVQVVAECLTVPLPVVQVEGESAEEREKKAWELARQEALIPFDLTEAPLLRLKLFRLYENRHFLFVNVHHIIFDGWSLGIMVRELARLYEANSAGSLSPLEELPVQYADFAHWQKEWLEEGETEVQLEYWKKQLAGELPRLQLPTDRTRPAKQSFRGEIETFVLPVQVSQRLKVLSRQEGTTLFMTLLAGFQVLLFRYTGQRDLLVGTPVANRNDSDLEGLIGLFVNTLVLRTDLSGLPTFRQLLQQVRDVCLNAYAHQDVPFEKLVEHLQPERDMSQTPLFQVMFSFQEGERRKVSAGPNLHIEPVRIQNGTAKFDLGLFMTEREGSLSGAFEYNTDLYDREMIRRMARHLSVLFEHAVTDPDRPISSLPILTETEWKWFLEELNQTNADYPECCIHHLFQKQVSISPDAVAVVFGEQELTYRELDRRSDGLASVLYAKGVERDEPIGIHLESSVDRLVAILAIWKAGGAYLPLDPVNPKERLTYMAKDAGLRWVLTSETSIPLWSDLPEIMPLDMNRNWEVEGQEWEKPVTDPDRLAYVIYTSGSTGIPKGVAVEHRALVNHMVWFQQEYPLKRSDRVLQITTFGFDASLLEWCAPLVAGAQLVIPEKRVPLHPDDLVAIIRDQGITRIQLVASVWRLLLNHPDLSECHSLRQGICGGESLTPALQKRFFSVLDAELIHLYGPTETCIDATHWRCIPQEDGERIPIGKPIANVEVYVLDDNLKPVPPGVAGELYIGGTGLARGYLNRPDLTERAFIPHPFSTDAGARLYKSGDLVRFRSDGNLEFLGRVDRQVKVRGFRIEPGEVEQTLLRHPAVREAVVLVVEGALTAYVVGNETEKVVVGEVKSFLQEYLPSYMVPSHILELESLPLAPNGKLNHRALPSPGSLDPQEKEEVARNRLELEMVSIWKSLLKVPTVGIRDNFFDIGGHSLKAIELLGAIRQTFAVELPLSALFRHQTIAELCDSIRHSNLSISDGLIMIQEGEKTVPLIVFHPGGGGVMCYVQLAKALGREETVYGFQAYGYETDEQPLTSIDEMADRYVLELKRTIPQGPYRLAGWSLGGTLAVEVARRLEEAGEVVAFIGLLDAHAFDYRVEQPLERKDPLDAWAETLGMPEKERAVAGEKTKLRWIWNRLQEKRILPPGAGLQTVRRYLSVMNANRLASFTYRFTTPIASDLYLFRSEEVAAVNPLPLVDSEKWRLRTRGKVYEIPVRGDHHRLMDPGYVDFLAEKMREVLAYIDDQWKFKR